jgi:hypothetical protein
MISQYRYGLTRVRVGAFRKAFVRARGMESGLSERPSRVREGCAGNFL